MHKSYRFFIQWTWTHYLIACVWLQAPFFVPLSVSFSRSCFFFSDQFSEVARTQFLIEWEFRHFGRWCVTTRSPSRCGSMHLLLEILRIVNDFGWWICAPACHWFFYLMQCLQSMCARIKHKLYLFHETMRILLRIKKVLWNGCVRLALKNSKHLLYESSANYPDQCHCCCCRWMSNEHWAIKQLDERL